MALVRIIGDSKKDLGEWRVIGRDPSHPEAPVEFRLRTLPYDEENQLQESYGQEETVQVENGEKKWHVRQRVFGVNDFRELSIRRAVYAWTDAKNFWVQPTDRAACSMVATALGVAIDDIKQGTEYCLDGKIASIKVEVLERHSALAEAIGAELMEMHKEANRIEKTMGKTS